VFRFEMLPLPSTFAFPSKQSSNHRFSWFRNYVRRSRATNLAVSLLATSLLLSLALNFRQWLRGVHSNYTVTNTPKAYLGAPLQPTTASHLIIVAGHAVWKVSVSRSLVRRRPGRYSSILTILIPGL
jgi:hypothetical protein